MHELGVLIHVVEQVSEVAAENQVESIAKLVLQVGELCSMIPKYMEKVYPAAIEGTILEGSELEIERIVAQGKCRQCGHVFGLIEAKGACPSCSDRQFDILQGREFIIKEIVCQ
ncbi:hydrogenase maturation nickel metallochaperone HypA [Clostridiales bacterium COT073_COT-073]|nr:hydrogenase maturation nickel metallochaperone HypA [Clostridiales bacterium COT073_COT-073]